MTAPFERTPEQQRNDRRAGIGCAGLLVLAGVACVIAGIVFLSPPPGTPTKARILSCDLRVANRPSQCRGIWSVDGRSYQGFVEGAGKGDIGDRLDVRAEGDSAKALRGRSFTAIGAFGMAGLCLGIGFAMGRAMLRRKATGLPTSG